MLGSIKIPMCNSVVTICLLFVLLGLPITAYTQSRARDSSSSEFPRQSLYFELFGNGVAFSFNYDVVFSSSLGYRLGINYLPDDTDYRVYNRNNHSHRYFTALGMGVYMIGDGVHRLELGLGILLGNIVTGTGTEERVTYITPSATIGYRYHPLEMGKATFKFAFTPYLSGNRVQPWFGISVGIMISADRDARRTR